MSVLWNLDYIRPIHEVVVPGETLPVLFTNAVRARGDAGEEVRAGRVVRCHGESRSRKFKHWY